MKKEFTIESWPVARWPNFSFNELRCTHSGLCYLDEDMMDNLQLMRNAIGSLRITSGYRDRTHPIEAAKAQPGSHFTGKAIDIACNGEPALLILNTAWELEFTGFGVKQSGEHSKRFLHLDCIQPEDNFHAPRPGFWSYS